MKLDNVNKIAKGLLSVMSHRRTLRLLLTLYTDIYIIPFLSNVKLHHVLLILTYLKFEEKIVNFTYTPIVRFNHLNCSVSQHLCFGSKYVLFDEYFYN